MEHGGRIDACDMDISILNVYLLYWFALVVGVRLYTPARLLCQRVHFDTLPAALPYTFIYATACGGATVT